MSHAHPTHVDAITKGEHYALASKFLQEMDAICAHVGVQGLSLAHPIHVDQLNAITKVEPYPMANKCLLEMVATCAHVRTQELFSAHPTHVDQVVG